MFSKNGRHGGQAFFWYWEREIRMMFTTNIRINLFVKSGVLNAVFGSRHSNEKEGSKIKAIRGYSQISKRGIPSERYGLFAQEQFSFAIIAEENVNCHSMYFDLDVHVLFHCFKCEQQKSLAFVRYMEILKLLDSTIELLGCLAL